MIANPTAAAPTPAIYAVRAMAPDELPLVMASWLRTYRTDAHKRKTNQWRDLSREEFYRRERARADRLIASCGVTVAELPEVPGEVLGWCCAGPGVLHYTAVKQDYHHEGVCRALLEAAGLIPGTYTASTMTIGVMRWVRGGRPIVFNWRAGEP